MRWRPRRPRRVDVPFVSRRVFDTAALEDGLVLDSAQGDAIDALLSAGSRGVYLWGGVGRGKSWLMDVYFAALPTERKRRLHFHEFLADLHSAVRRHRCDLDAALDELLAGLDVVCLDEFHVHDPADGIFVGRLSAALFERNVLVVLTSNYPPDGLLPNPLFHEGFVPTIELIERSLTVVGVNGPVDYRTVRSRHDTGFAAGAWISPGNDIQLSALGLHRPGTSERRVLRPAGHPLPAQRVRPDCLWFDFRDLCGGTTAPVCGSGSLPT